MKKVLIQSYKIRFLLLLAFVLIPSLPQAQEHTAMKMGLYVVVDDMRVAKQFYQQLFGVEPSIDYGDFVSFRFDQSIFALFSENAYGHKLNRGNNVVPYIQVENIEAEFERIRKISPQMIHNKIVDEGVIKLFMFSDPSGNKIEFYSIN